MRLVLAASALVCAAALIVPASAVGVPRSHGLASMVETVQQQPQSKPLSKKQKREQCFVRCWHSCWGLHCVERCRCGCSDEKLANCAKLIWSLSVGVVEVDDQLAHAAAFEAFRGVLPDMPEEQAKVETNHAIAFAAANHTAWFWDRGDA